MPFIIILSTITVPIILGFFLVLPPWSQKNFRSFSISVFEVPRQRGPSSGQRSEPPGSKFRRMQRSTEPAKYFGGNSSESEDFGHSPALPGDNVRCSVKKPTANPVRFSSIEIGFARGQPILPLSVEYYIRVASFLRQFDA